MFILYAVVRLGCRLDLTLSVSPKHGFGSLSKSPIFCNDLCIPKISGLVGYLHTGYGNFFVLLISLFQFLHYIREWLKKVFKNRLAANMPPFDV